MNESSTFVVYKKRYLILFLAFAHQLSTTFQSLEYTIIANVVSSYYNVSYELVLMTAIVMAIANVVFSLPASWTSKHVGIRNVFLASALLDCTATILKCFTINNNLFWLVIVAQSIDGIAMAGFTSLNMQIARVWFPQREIARATTVLFLSYTTGGLLSSIVPVAFVANVQSKAMIAKALSELFIIHAIISFTLFIVSLFFFDERPPTAPSRAEDEVQDLRQRQTFIAQLSIVFNRNLILICMAAGIVTLTRGALNMMFNQMLALRFDNNLYWVSLVSALYSVSKIISSYCGGLFLDVTHRYKTLILTVTPITCGLFGLFAFAFYVNSKILIIIVPVLIGFSMGPLNTTFANFAAEVTYPAPESITSAVLMFFMETSIVFAVVFSWIQTLYGDFSTALVMGSSLLFVILITIFVKCDLRRQNTECETCPIISYVD